MVRVLTSFVFVAGSHGIVLRRQYWKADGTLLWTRTRMIGTESLRFLLSYC